ncbi:MAG: hypothetical protein Q9191_006442 [Dirinaria sp. TL-2023a]
MPFSSPMGEEVLSPTSPSTPQSTPHRHQLGSQNNMGGNNASVRSQEPPVQKSTPVDAGRTQEKALKQQRWPGLNVVTNFSKPPVLAQRAADPGVRPTALPAVNAQVRSSAEVLPNRKYSGHRKQNLDSCHVEKNGQEGKGTSKAALDAQAMAGLGLQHFDQGVDKASYSAKDRKGPVSDLKRKSSRMMELSPSDRLIAIGISVTPTSLTERTSPETARKRSPGLSAHQHAVDQGASSTPSIVVTPARHEAPWSASSDERQPPRKPRPASSVYSQATQRGRAASQPSSIPPVPALPSASSSQKPRNASEPHVDSHNDKPSTRIASACTDFDQDEGAATNAGVRAHSGRPRQLRIRTRPSMDSIATRRSQGWWNYIISPFSAKPGTPTFPTKYKARDVAEIGSPQSSEATKIGEDLEKYDEEKKDKCSPVDRASFQSEQNHASIRTEDSRLERWREAHGLVFQDTSRDSTMRPDLSRELDLQSPAELSLSPEGFGTAAEYYQACWHDQNSPTPYFECQNHTCMQPKPRYGETELGPESMIEAPQEPAPIPAREPQTTSEQETLKAAAFQQTPSNRFSAAFKEAVKSKARPASESTIIEDVDTTPEVEEAHIAPVVRAAAPASTPKDSSQEPLMVSRDLKSNPEQSAASTEPVRKDPDDGVPQPKTTLSGPVVIPAAERPPKRFVAVMPPDPAPFAIEPPVAHESESYVTPEHPIQQPVQKSAAVLRDTQQSYSTDKNDWAATERPSTDGQRPVYIVNHYHGNYQRPPPPEEQLHLSELYPPPREKSTTEENREKHQRMEVERKEKKRRQKSGGRGCLPARNCFMRDKPTKKKKKWLLICVALALLIMIILILSLALTLTRKGDKMPVQTQWLNITGFPPIPTGISTIIDPDAAYEQAGCVSPTTLWSCALPKEEQASVAPNKPDQPNFRVEIRFQNGTNVSAAANATLTKRSGERVSNVVSAGGIIRRDLLRIRDLFSNSLFTPSPAAPSLEDQTFLGNTTDNNTAPFDGEVTPFFMSFESANKLSSRLLKRASSTNTSDTNGTDPFPDLTDVIPPPDTNPDGTAAAANLLPFPSAQPLRLYNRGLPTEHYGFYTYFDRSIFLTSTALLNETTEQVGNVPNDENGGAEETAATVRCTWAQTRFLVQIWTNRGGSASLVSSSNSTNSTTATSSSSSGGGGSNHHPKNLTASSANDFVRPGSFPYPVSITLDRHGGDPEKKMIYCYGVNDRQRIIPDHKKLQLEDRAFQGRLINPAQGPFGQVNVSRSEGGPGGIDGGTGGCGCIWRNWQGVE